MVLAIPLEEIAALFGLEIADEPVDAFRAFLGADLGIRPDHVGLHITWVDGDRARALDRTG